MRNRLRVLAFDVLAPLGAILALVYVGVALAWPLWWVSVCSVLCLLIVQGVVVNVVLFRRDGVTVGTDDDGPGLRLAVVGLATAALAAAVVGRLHAVDGAGPPPCTATSPRWSASPAAPPRRRRRSPRRARTPTSTGSTAMMTPARRRAASAANSTRWQRI